MDVISAARRSRCRFTNRAATPPNSIASWAGKRTSRGRASSIRRRRGACSTVADRHDRSRQHDAARHGDGAATTTRARRACCADMCATGVWRFPDVARHRAPIGAAQRRLRARRELELRADDPHVQPQSAAGHGTVRSSCSTTCAKGCTWRPTARGRSTIARLNFQFGYADRLGNQKRKRDAWSRIPTYGGDDPALLERATPSAMQRRGSRGARRIAARASRCKPAARRRPPRRHVSATSRSASAMHADRRRALAARIVARGGADGLEAIVTSERRALTRFTHEYVNQNVDVEDVGVRVRAVVDGRTGVASTNAVDDESIDAVVERAIAIAAFAPRENPPPLPGRPAAYDAAAGRVRGSDRRGDAVRAGRPCAAHLRQAARNGCWCSGYVTTAETGLTIATSNGADASFDATTYGANVKMVAGDSTGFAERYGVDVGELDGELLGAVSAEKARTSAAPVAVDPGRVDRRPRTRRVRRAGPFSGRPLLRAIVRRGFVVSRRAARRTRDGRGRHDPRRLRRTRCTPTRHSTWKARPNARTALIERGVAQTVLTDSTWARRLDGRTPGTVCRPRTRDGPYPARSRRRCRQRNPRAS